MFQTSSSIETLKFSEKDPMDEVTKGKCVFPELVWLPGDEESEKFTFPQVSPSLLLQETPFSLDSKVPLIPALDDVMVLRTTKLGTKRFPCPQNAVFDMRTPNSPSLYYNFLHDPHLKKYLARPSVRKSLINQGLITEDGFVKCAPKEFNEFRKWIRRLKLNSMEATAREEAEKKSDEDEHAHGKLTEHSRHVFEMMHRKQYEARRKYRMKKKKDFEERKRLMKSLELELKSIEEKKKEDKRIKKIVYKQKEGDVERKRALHVCKEKNITTMRMQQLSEKDAQYMKRKQELAETRGTQKKEKQTEAIEKWKRRQSYCLKMMEEKKLQIEKETQERKNRIESRNEKLEKGRRKMEKAFEKSTQMSRELALKQMQLANSFSEKAEARKEAEIMRWREKYSSTSKKGSKLDDRMKDEANCEAIETKEKTDTKEMLPVNGAFNTRLATLEESISEENLSSSFVVQDESKLVSEKTIPNIEVIECMESNHSAMVFDEPEDNVQAVKHSSCSVKASNTAVNSSKSHASVSTSGRVSSFSNFQQDASVHDIAKQVAKLALMKAAGQLDFDPAHVKSGHDKINIGKNKKFHSKSRSNSSIRITRSVNASLNRRSKLSMKSTSKISKSTDEIVSHEANRLAENAVESVQLILGCDQPKDNTSLADGVDNKAASESEAVILQSESTVTVDAPSNDTPTNNNKRLSILLNAEEGLQHQAQQVTKKAILGAVKELGSNESTVEKASEMIDSILDKKSKMTTENQKDCLVHFEEELADTTPRDRSKSISERIPTPHASYTTLSQDERSDSTDLLYSKQSNECLESVSSKSACKKLDLEDSQESVQSTESNEKRERSSKKGRRPTPFFSKNVFPDMKSQKGRKLMETFGEVDEEGILEMQEDSHATLEECDEAFASGHSYSEMSDDNAIESSHRTVSNTSQLLTKEDCDLTQNDKQHVASTHESPDSSKTDEAAKNTDREQEMNQPNTKASLTETDNNKPNVTDAFESTASVIREADQPTGTQRQGSKTSVKKGPSLSLMQQNVRQHPSKRSMSINGPHDFIRENRSVSFFSMQSSNPRMQRGHVNSGLVGRDTTTAKLKSQSRDSVKKDSVNSSNKLVPVTTQGASGMNLIDKSSQKTVESTSSHFLPKIRPSRSRMICNLDPSIYSCTSEEISDNEGPNSKDILDNDGEKETVVRIERRSEIDLNDGEVKQSLKEPSLDNTNASAGNIPNGLLRNSSNADMSVKEIAFPEDKGDIQSANNSTEVVQEISSDGSSQEQAKTPPTENNSTELICNSNNLTISSKSIANDNSNDNIQSVSTNMLQNRPPSGEDDIKNQTKQENIENSPSQVNSLASSMSESKKLCESKGEDLGGEENKPHLAKTSQISIDKTGNFSDTNENDAAELVSGPSSSIAGITEGSKEMLSSNGTTMQDDALGVVDFNISPSEHSASSVNGDGITTEENQTTELRTTTELTTEVSFALKQSGSMKTSSESQLSNTNAAVMKVKGSKEEVKYSSVFAIPSSPSLLTRKTSDSKQSSKHKPRPDTPKPPRTKSRQSLRSGEGLETSTGHLRASNDALMTASTQVVRKSDSNRRSLEKLKKMHSVEMKRRKSNEITAELLKDNSHGDDKADLISNDGDSTSSKTSETSLHSGVYATPSNSRITSNREAVKSRVSVSQSRASINDAEDQNGQVVSVARRLTPKSSFSGVQQKAAMATASIPDTMHASPSRRSYHHTKPSQNDSGKLVPSTSNRSRISPSNSPSVVNKQISSTGKTIASNSNMSERKMSTITKSYENAAASEEDNENLVVSRSSRFNSSAPKSSFTGSKIYVAPVDPALDFTASLRSNIQSGSNTDIHT